MADSLDELLRQCTVRLVTPARKFGTGFFVGPGSILTCAHVVCDPRGRAQAVEVESEAGKEEGRVEALVPDPCPAEDNFPDLALVRIARMEHPCVRLDPTFAVGDLFYTFGYPEGRRHGDSLTTRCEGVTRFGEGPDREAIKCKEGQVWPGFSGAPLLNLRTGGVCGMVKRTRDEQTDLGGFGVRGEVVLRNFPFLAEQQARFHGGDRAWADLLDTRERLLRLAAGFALDDLFALLDRGTARLPLSPRVTQFRTLVKERTRDFVGRDFVFKGIDAALTDPAFPSGYVIIRGEPGIGKTSLVCELVR
jgi:hypothetical protein